METSGGPTPPLPATFDPTGPRHTSPHKDGGNLPTEGACYNTSTSVNSSQLLTGLTPPTLPLPPHTSSADERFGFTGLEGAEQLQQLYNISPLTSTLSTTFDREKLSATASTDHSPGHAPSELPGPWVPVSHVIPESSTSSWVGGAASASVSMLPGEGGGGDSKKQPLLYGLFTRSEDGSRWHCEECKRLFSSQGSLRAHARIHTGERPYQCQYCFRAFCQASTLRSHERLHTGEKPYKCEDCGRAFTQSAGLRSHRKTHRYDS